MNTELAYRVLDHIRAQPEEHDQNIWIEVSSCGTTACFAGWAVILGHAEAARRVEIERERYDHVSYHWAVSMKYFPEINGSKDMSVSELAMKVLDLSVPEGDVLFSFGKSVEELEDVINAIASGADVTDWDS